MTQKNYIDELNRLAQQYPGTKWDKKWTGVFRHILGGEMEYKKFKTYIYKKIVKDFGFIKNGKDFYYDSQDVRVFLNIDKSQYDNAAMITVWISIKKLAETYNREIPISYQFADIAISFMNGNYYELENCNDFSDIDEKLAFFNTDILPKIIHVESLRSFYKDKKSKTPNEAVNKFLNL